MATMVLKDTIKCNCGKEMFAASMDKVNRIMRYQCIDVNCGETVEKSFDEARLHEGERFGYFCLNDDGEITWKCANHGYCDFNIEWFEDDWQDKVNRFVEMGCALESFFYEIQEEIESIGERAEDVKRLLAHLDEEQMLAVAEEMGIEVIDDIIGAFCAEFEAGLLDMAYDSWEEYEDQIICALDELDLLAE